MRRDIIVIGAGTAARSAAVEAARCGLSVLLAPGDDVALARAAATTRARRVHAAIGRLRGTGRVSSAARGLHRLLAVDMVEELVGLREREPRIEVRRGPVEFSSPHAIRLAGEACREAGIVVVATDGHPRRPVQLGFDDRLVCDAESVWLRNELPRSAVVLGADAEGCALACRFAVLGVPVTLIDRRSRSLRYVDRDVLERFHEAIHALGVDVILSEDIEGVEPIFGGGERVVVSLASGRREICDVLVVAGGREAGTAPLRLDRANVETDPRGFVLVDDRGRTSQDGVFAIGRAVSELGPYADEYLGRSVVRTALGLTEDGPGAVPLVVESLPEIAMVGLTAEMCRHLDVPHVESASELYDRGPETPDAGLPGLLKLVVHSRSKALLGVQVLGFGALEVVQLGSLLVAKERSIRELLSLAAPDESPYTAYSAAARDALRSSLSAESHASP